MIASLQFGLYDLVVLFFYLVLVTWIGLYFSKTESGNDFFLAGKTVPWYFLLLSLIATETSSLTFLHVPGISYKTNICFLQLAFGYIIGRTLVAYVLLPIYFSKGYFSIYELVGEKFGNSAKKTISGIFLITRVLGDGVRLFATSIPITFLLKGFFGDGYSDLQLGVSSLVLITVSTTIYTVYGGFRSVVATDVIQFIVYVLGGVFVVWFLSKQIGATHVLSRAMENGKLEFYLGMKGNFLSSPYFFINGIISGILLTIGSHGVDQMFVQRVLACKTILDARLTMITSGVLVFLQFVLFLYIGLLLFIFYGETNSISQEQVFSKFIVENLPSPLGGLMLAAILASAMSTLSSSINSMSLSILTDWSKINFSEETEIIAKSRNYSILWGIVLFFSALVPMFLVSGMESGLVELGLKVASFTYGPLIGLFLMLRFHKNITGNSNSVIASVLFSVIASYLSGSFGKFTVGNILLTGIISFVIMFNLLQGTWVRRNERN